MIQDCDLDFSDNPIWFKLLQNLCKNNNSSRGYNRKSLKCLKLLYFLPERNEKAGMVDASENFNPAVFNWMCSGFYYNNILKDPFCTIRTKLR